MIRSRLNKGVTNAQAEAFTRNPKSKSFIHALTWNALGTLCGKVRHQGVRTTMFEEQVTCHRCVNATASKTDKKTDKTAPVVLDNKMAAKFLLVAVQYLRRGGIPASNIRRMVNVEILRTPNPAVPGCDCDACGLAREQLRSHR